MARGAANCLRDSWLSSDHCLPTRRARPLPPISSELRYPWRRLTASIAAPSSFAHLACATPSLLRGERGVDCQLCVMEQGETIHDDFNATLVHLMSSRIRTFVETRPQASRQTLPAALSSAKSRRPRTHACARCTVVAKDVERTATPAGTHCGEERGARGDGGGTPGVPERLDNT